MKTKRVIITIPDDKMSEAEVKALALKLRTAKKTEALYEAAGRH